MKKLSIILMAFLLVFAACKKDEKEETDPNALNPTAAQKGFSIEYTSTSCSICGRKGGPLIHKYAKDAPNSVVIALHVNASDPMTNNSLAWGFNGDRPSGGGIPSFWVGDTKTTYNDQDAMNTLVASGDAIAGVDIKYEIDGSTMKVETLTKFFGAGSGDYYLSVYVLEDGIDGSAAGQYKQAGGASNYLHDFVIRACTAGDVMGEKIATSPAKDAEFSKSYSINLDASWEKSLYAVAVLWKFDGTANIKYSFVNAMRR